MEDLRLPQTTIVKYLVGGIVLVLLFILGLGAFALWGNNNAGKISLPTVIPPSEESVPVAGVADDSEQEDEAIGTGKGGPVGEITGYERVEGYEEYVHSYHSCHLEISNPTAYNAIGHISREYKIEGNSFALKVDSVKKGEYLNFSLVYDDNGKEQIWLNFKSDSVEKVSFLLREGRVQRQVFYYSYSGCLTNPNDEDYEYCIGKNKGVTVVETSSETGFAIEGAFFSSWKKEATGSSLPLKPSFRLVIEHKGTSTIE